MGGHIHMGDMPHVGISSKSLNAQAVLYRYYRLGRKGRTMSRTNLQSLRAKRGLSQTALAERIGTTLNMYGKLERGERRLNITWLRRLADALEVGMDEIVAEVDPVAETNEQGLPLPTIDALRAMIAEHYRGVVGKIIDPEMLDDLAKRVFYSVENWRDEPIAARDPQVALSVARQINRRFDH